MPKLPGGCWVLAPDEGRSESRGSWTSLSVVTPEHGAKYVAQRIHRFASGRSPLLTNPRSEEVHYVLAGLVPIFETNG